MRKPWNHNIHHGFVLRSLPAGAEQVLDVGCGRGFLTRELAACFRDVTGLDSDHEALDRARELEVDPHRISYVEGDIMIHPLREASFDAITGIAVLHHLPLKPALIRFSNLLRPGGVLVIVGLYRRSTFGDYLAYVAGVIVSVALRLWNSREEVGAPISEPRETLLAIRSACSELLPGSVVKRRLLFRYTLVWGKP